MFYKSASAGPVPDMPESFCTKARKALSLFFPEANVLQNVLQKIYSRFFVPCTVEIHYVAVSAICVPSTGK
jgi:hypothetical protein